MEPILSIKNVSKSFGVVKALENVSVDFFPGEVHAIMGENGAGKSTLMRILFGLYRKDSGDIVYNGKTIEFRNPKDALDSGIVMVHQELNSVLDRTVAENMFLGREISCFGVVSESKINNATKRILDNIGITDIKPKERMRDLDIARMQLVEIAKASSYNPKVLILDEATSSLTEKEVKRLFALIESFKKAGTAILYITHKMDEVFLVSDKVTVLRDGCLIGTNLTKDVTKDQLIRMMVNREVKDVYPKTKSNPGEVLLEVRGFTRENQRDNINFYARRGEILGMAGLIGAGRTEIVESIFGLRKDYSGEILIDGKKVVIKRPADAIANHIALITEDRKLSGLNLKGTIKDNASLVILKNLCKAGIVNRKKQRKKVLEQTEQLAVKAPSIDTLVTNLSGGNQQKVVLSKWLLSNADILIMDEPTRGIDVGAKLEIYNLMNALKAQGKAIIMISSEMEELIGICDRMVVMYRGKVTAILEGDEINQEQIMLNAVETKESIA